ncbi:hypothetical protein C5167_007363 [Papaver somniferum]|uniref:beta-amyrin 28-monooxygenase-like n=1 Tax=Papaver somniferum TaxID=3469 RepID=UPI000E6F76A9|nr:beta-amyrin 28-monooxygenase-like [Papaver somniferum]RZC86177.1 hypothetical protein C5167_007363 [Papaver somniferum]
MLIPHLFLMYSLILLITSLCFIYLFSSSKKKSSDSIDPSTYPPGKTGWPIIGETIKYVNAGRKGVPENFIQDRMEKYSKDIFKTSLLCETTAVLCGPAGNKYLFTNENKLVFAWWPRTIEKIFPPPSNISGQDEAKKMRRILPQFLSPETLRRHIPVIDRVVMQYLERDWDNKKQVTVYPLAKSYTFGLGCHLFLSIQDLSRIEELGKPFRYLVAGIFSFPIDLPGTAFNRGIKASKFIRNELSLIIKQRKIDLAEQKALPTQDILSHMLSSVDDDGNCMDELDIANKILGLLIGGFDATSATISFIMKYLAELPHVYYEVRKEQMEIASSKGPGESLNWNDMQKMKYSWNVVCEILRLEPPLQGAFREAIADINYGGFSVPKGWKLYWSAHSTHKDPNYFKEPEKFDPMRFKGKGPAPYTYIPFGGGPRMCPGKEYAKLSILAFMYHVVTRYKWEKVLPHEKIVVNPIRMPAKGLPIRLQPLVI